MALTNLQKSVLEKARASGVATMGVALSDETCKFLMAIIAQDLGISDRLADLRGGNSDFFSCAPSDAVLSVSTGLYELFESLVSIVPDADTYFSCLQHFTKAG